MADKNSGEVENENIQSGQKGMPVGGDATKNVFITGDEPTINMGGPTSQDSGRKTTNRKRRKHSKKNKRKMNVAVVVALIGLAGVVITAVLTSPMIDRLVFSTPVSSFTPTVYVSETPTLSQAALESETPINASTDTLTPMISASPLPDTVKEKMMPIFYGSPLDGKAPMLVNFNARESFVILPDGTSIPCGTTRLCDYTFKVMLNDKVFKEDANTNGLYSYRFEKRGVYTVTVYVCRDETCGGSQVTVNVR